MLLGVEGDPCFANHKWEALQLVVAYYELLRCILQNTPLNTGCEISDGLGSQRQHHVFLFWRWSLLINSTIKLKLWCDFFFFPFFFAQEERLWNVTRGFQSPLEVLNSERSLCYVLLILLEEFGNNKAGEYFITLFMFGLRAASHCSRCLSRRVTQQT